MRAVFVLTTFIAFSIAVVVAGCSGPSSPPAAPSGPVRRIVSLAPNLTEAAFFLGAGDRVIGVTDYCDYPPETTSRRRVGPIATPNLEVVLSLGPDLVLVSRTANPISLVDTLGRAGLRTFEDRADGVAGTLAMLGDLADALGADAGALRRLDDLRVRRAALAARAEKGPRRRVLLLVGRSPLVAAGPGTFPSDCVRLAGGENVVAVGAVAYPHLSLEGIVALAPEVVIDASEEGGEPPAPLAGKWVVLPAAPIVRAGPRVIEGVESIERAIRGKEAR